MLRVLRGYATEGVQRKLCPFLFLVSSGKPGGSNPNPEIK
jgi:hypothetical protein